jgi:hypothetical protein
MFPLQKSDCLLLTFYVAFPVAFYGILLSPRSQTIHSSQHPAGGNPDRTFKQAAIQAYLEVNGGFYADRISLIKKRIAIVLRLRDVL